MLTYLAKRSILGAWQDSEYASSLLQCLFPSLSSESSVFLKENYGRKKSSFSENFRYLLNG